MMLALIFILSFVGMGLLCLARRKHWRQLFATANLSLTRARGLQILGSIALLMAAILSSIAYGVGIGLTLLFGILTIAVIAIAVALPYVDAKA